MAYHDFPRIYLYRRIVQAKLFIDGHYADNINLDSIAGSALFSKFHFIRQFKTIYGKTPHQYLMYVRINKAVLLLESGASVAEAGYAVGFDSITSFTGLFKRMLKQTPSGYQQRFFARKADIGKTPLKYVPNCFADAGKRVKKSNFEEVGN